MEPKEILKEINKLKLSEKLILAENIWDLIAQDNSELPLPEWQKIELDKRYSEYKSGNQNIYNWESVHNSLQKKVT